MQRTLRELLVDGTDYGVIPGTRGKPTLLKPGAEKVRLAFALADTYDIERDTDVEYPHRGYEVKCLIADQQGIVVASGVGYCATMESRYRWRWVGDRDIPANVDPGQILTRRRSSRNGGEYTQYRIENADPADQYNTVLKIAKKRALVDAMLSIAALSEIFTQDVEDMAQNVDAAEQRERRQTPAQRQQATRPTTQAGWQQFYEDRADAGAKPATLRRIIEQAESDGFEIAVDAEIKEVSPADDTPQPNPAADAPETYICVDCGDEVESADDDGKCKLCASRAER